ncbi:MAG TPA: antitoxin VapB family protein [Candidatus Thermoplasmatota archaeon]|nr:antitoxin VapB family protein [Candidatus Thermoplasmatota archaeon]
MVQFSDEAYRRLAAEKRKGESFSDVVLRILPRGSLSELWKLGRSSEEIEAHVRMLEEATALDQADADRWADRVRKNG